MNFLRIFAIGFICIILIIFVLLFKQNIFIFFENLRMAFWGSTNLDFSYRNLLAFKLSQQPTFATLATSSVVLHSNYNLLKADIYSNYPFNNYGVIVLAAGEKDGLKVGMPVLVSSTTILGIITSVNLNTALVTTIFDPQWKSAVFLGEQKINGLLVGGFSPAIDYVEKNATTTADLLVYNADSRFPLNLIFGKTNQFKIDNIWQKSQLNFSYDLASLREVFVLLNFK